MPSPGTGSTVESCVSGTLGAALLSPGAALLSPPAALPLALHHHEAKGHSPV